MTDLPARAESLARHLHAGQTDKLGLSYVEHMEAVVGRYRNSDIGTSSTVYRRADGAEYGCKTLERAAVSFGTNVAPSWPRAGSGQKVPVSCRHLVERRYAPARRVGGVGAEGGWAVISFWGAAPAAQDAIVGG